MKMVLLVLTMTLASSAFASARCNLKVMVKPHQQSCAYYTKKFDVTDEADCRSLAQEVSRNRFFGVLDARDIVISARYKYKDGRRRVKDIIEFRNNEEYCF